MILKKFLFFMQPFGAIRDIDSEKGNEPFENRPVYSRDDDINETLQRYSDMVYKLAFARTKNQSDAEDIFQEVFLKYISSGTSFESEEHKKAWLITVTINQSKKLFSSAWIRHRASLADAAEQAVPPLQLADEEGVAAAVLKLPAAYRLVIHLFYYEDLSLKQISSILNKKEGTVKSQLNRARALLKKELGGT